MSTVADQSDQAHLVPLNNEADLDQAFAHSSQAPIWLFLNDPYCPISRAAKRQVERYVGAISVIDVSRQHDLSRAVEMRTGVRHESPQLLLLANGQAVWDASHFDITVKAMQQALETHAKA